MTPFLTGNPVGRAGVWIGIDPGAKGGVAIIFEGDAAIIPLGIKDRIATWRSPVIEGRVNAQILAGMLRLVCPNGRPFYDAVVALEKVHAMPQQGVSSTFKFGVNYGTVLGVVGTIGYRLELVTPQAWKKVILAGVGDKDKKATIAWATRAYPNVSLIPPGGRVPSDGIADALALASYAQRTYR